MTTISENPAVMALAAAGLFSILWLILITAIPVPVGPPQYLAMIVGSGVIGITAYYLVSGP
ncbi:MAG: hypothetical protein ACLFR6_01900 [Salinarchaeum sp.]